MLNALVPYVLAIRHRWPRLFNFLVATGKRFLGKRLGVYPRPLANEIGAVKEVLLSSQWNMAYGKGLTHEQLEHEFGEYLGGGYAIAVNTGGMALQMALRALGLKPGDEVVHQVDTCSATAMAVMNAGCTPRFADVSPDSFMLSMDSVGESIGPQTKALLATHMWGNLEDVNSLLKLKNQSGLALIEDCCLALGARYADRPAGSFGDVGVFSFGCLKPIQAGEGGMLFTRNEALARELRAMRHWGDRTLEYGVRDAFQLSWNGRMSEIVAAVVREQLKGYPRHLEQLRDAVQEFEHFLHNIDGLELVVGSARSSGDASYTQIVLKLDEQVFGWPNDLLRAELYKRGVQVRHANFEPITSLTFIHGGKWKDWLPVDDHEAIARNYARPYPAAEAVFRSTGLGLGNINFLSRDNLKNVMRQIAEVASKKA